MKLALTLTRCQYFVCAALLTISASAQSPFAIKAKEGGTTESDFLKVQRAWCERTMAIPFRERVAGKPWAAEAASYLEAALAVWNAGAEDRADPALVTRGEALIASGCNDPLSLYFAAHFSYVMSEEGMWDAVNYDPIVHPPGAVGKQTSARFRDAIKGLEKVRAPRGVLRLVAMELANLHERSQRAKDRAEWDKRAADWTRESLTDGSFTEAEEVVFIRHTIQRPWVAGMRRDPEPMAPAVEEAKLSEWAMHLLRGTLADCRWKPNPSLGRPDEIEKRSGPELQALAQRTRDEYLAAWKLRPDRPEADGRLLGLSMQTDLLPGQPMELWFQRAIDAQFDYLPVYDSHLFYIHPRWGGTLEKMLEFGRACAATKRFDTGVPAVLEDAVAKVWGWTHRDREVYRRAEVRAALHAMTEGYLQHPGHRGEREYWQSRSMLYDWLGGDYGNAAKTFAAFGGRLPLSMERWLHRNNWNPSAFAGDLALLAGPANGPYAEAEKHFESREYDRARAAYEKALAKCGDSAPAVAWLKARLGLVEFEQSFARGDWTPVHADPGLLNWYRSNGDWEAAPDGALINHGHDLPGVLVFQGRVGYDYEMRCTIEATRDDKGSGKAWFGAMVQWRGSENFYTCQVRTLDDAGTLEGTMLNRLYSSDAPRVKAEPSTKSQFLIRLSQRRVAFELNGKTIFEKQVIQERFDWDPGRIGFASFLYPAGQATRMSGMEIRRLPATAPVR